MTSNPTHRILIVDDEPIVLRALSETLKEEGYEVVAVRNAVEGLDLVRQQRFAVVITDQRMPKVLGLEFLEQVKSLQPSASRVLVTAVLNIETLVEAINKVEVHRFITKPWLREELLEAVRAGVQRYELEQKRAGQHDDLETRNERSCELNTLLVREAIAKTEELKKIRELACRSGSSERSQRGVVSVGADGLQRSQRDVESGAGRAAAPGEAGAAAAAGVRVVRADELHGQEIEATIKSERGVARKAAITPGDVLVAGASQLRRPKPGAAEQTSTACHTKRKGAACGKAGQRSA